MTVAAGPDVSSSPHILLLYRTEAQRQARIVSWVREGLALGEKILYSTVPGDPLVPALTVSSADVVPALRKGQIAVIPAEDVFPRGRQAEQVQEAFDEGYEAVRLFARADVGLEKTSFDRYQAVDALTDELCATLPVTALCQLDVASAGSATLTSVIGTHGGIVEDAQMRLTRRGGRLVLAGEVDFSSAHVLAEALRSASRQEPAAPVLLDLSELSFLDVSGSRALAVGTEELRRTGGTMTIVGATGHLHRVLSLLGIDRLHGVVLR